MHEYSIARALVTRVAEEARASEAASVRRVRVRIGELSGVDTGLLKTAYAVVREGTACGDAALDVLPVAARWACRDCGGPIRSGGPLRCASCGGAASLQAGDELLLEQIELEAR